MQSQHRHRYHIDGNLIFFIVTLHNVVRLKDLLPHKYLLRLGKIFVYTIINANHVAKIAY